MKSNPTRLPSGAFIALVWPWYYWLISDGINVSKWSQGYSSEAECIKDADAFEAELKAKRKDKK